MLRRTTAKIVAISGDAADRTASRAAQHHPGARRVGRSARPHLTALPAAPAGPPQLAVIDRLRREVDVLDAAMQTLGAAPILRTALREIRDDVDALSAVLTKAGVAAPGSGYAQGDDGGGEGG